jgi:hypothetical protein
MKKGQVFRKSSDKNFDFFRLLALAILIAGCVAKENIHVPLSNPRPHPQLGRLQTNALVEKQGVVYWGASKRYRKRGITVVLLKGDPYER